MLENWAEQNKLKYNILKIGIDNQKSDFKAYNIKETEAESTYNINIENEKHLIEVNVGGKHFVYNSLCAIAVGKVLGVDLEKISNRYI